MKPHWEVSNDIAKRTIYTRISGILSEEDVRAWAAAYREKTAAFKGRRHMCIADMRGMRPLSVAIANLLGAEIGWARKNGVVLCAHISDDTVQRLQAARVARQNSAHDDATIDCATLEEARRVCEEVRAKLDDPSVSTSARAFAHAR
jgi:hypothetical protein